MPGLVEAIKLRQECSDRLLMISFDDVSVYLSLLEAICTRLRPFGPSVLVYLAAAVSDFYLSEDNLPEHKIQSCRGGLQLTLSVVPKLLKKLVKDIVPEAFVVSFKLETDESMLIVKSRQALETYGHQVSYELIIRNKQRRIPSSGRFPVENIRCSIH
ncbi:unnamed protein product [Gongylonema pulchrum]|uniref:DFP domain-containing protein n=1 Tax=Gongylonema pulchrum TaxID=637853 RepID=A0A183E4U4_9BILA|nr:unnamed protein product [Gongylonema pulchrum]